MCVEMFKFHSMLLKHYVYMNTLHYTVVKIFFSFITSQKKMKHCKQSNTTQYYKS